jgi:hypothetical protein
MRNVPEVYYSYCSTAFRWLQRDMKDTKTRGLSYAAEMFSCLNQQLSFLNVVYKYKIACFIGLSSKIHKNALETTYKQDLCYKVT